MTAKTPAVTIRFTKEQDARLRKALDKHIATVRRFVPTYDATLTDWLRSIILMHVTNQELTK